MRKIKIVNWKAKDSQGNEVEENLLSVLNVLIGSKSPDQMPKGLDLFRCMNRIGRAFDVADSSGFLELEDSDFEFLKKTIENDIPSSWGVNKNIAQAVESFLSA